MSIEGHTNTRIGAYLLGEVIGRGGMGVVYKAMHEHLGREVALKLLAPELSGNDEFRRRFLRESRLAASLDHPNIITVYDAGDADGTLYIAMRYVEGADLAQYLRDQGPLEPLAALSLLDQVAAALDTAHENGLIHRDVKPANVMVASGRCYLTDFGLTKQTSAAAGMSALTRTGSFLGTLNYTAPEQIEGREITGSADLYALGCVLQECLTGAPPFSKDSEVALLYAHLSEPPPPPSQVRPDLPPALDGVMAKALAKLPADRYASCGEFVAAARAAITQDAGATRLAQPPTVPVQSPTVPTEPTEPTVAAQPTAEPTVAAQPSADPTVAAQPSAAITRREASPTLTQKPGEPAPPGRRGSRRRIVLLAAGAAAVAVAIVGVVIASGGSSSKPSRGSAGAGSASGAGAGSASGAGAGSASGGAVFGRAIKVGNSPDGLAPGHGTDKGTLFVASAGAGTVYAVDEVNGTISSQIEYANHSNPAAPLTNWQGTIMVGDTSAGTVQAINLDKTTGRLVKGVTIPVAGVDPGAMTKTPNGNLWISSYTDPTIAFIKPGTTQAHVIPGLGNGPKRMAPTGSTLFVANQSDGNITEVNPSTGQIMDTIHVGANPSAINYNDGILWVADLNQNTVTRYRVGSGTPPSLTKMGNAIPVGKGPKRLTSGSPTASGAHYMWVANSGDGTVTPIALSNNQALRPISVGGHPNGITGAAVTLADHAMWVAVWSNSSVPDAGGPLGGPAGGVQQIDESKMTLSTP